MSAEGYHVVKLFVNLQGRHTAHVERTDGRAALGYSWSNYEAATADAIAYLEEDKLPEHDFPAARLRFKGRGYALDTREEQAWRGVEVVPASEAEALRSLLREFQEHRTDSSLAWIDGWSRRVDALFLNEEGAE